jgi:molybdopterin/thiamine biosynthesis adenylyltransferase
MMTEPGDVRSVRDMRLRQMELIGPEGLAKLRKSRVAILGLGNVGGQIAHHLGLLGLSITLVDRDRVGPENLSTQAFSPDEVGLPKAIARANALRCLNPDCDVKPIHASVESLGLGVFRDRDLILAAVDSIPARFAINEIAMRLGIPWQDAAIDGSGLSYTARIASYPGGPTGACMLCSLDPLSVERLIGANAASAGCPTWWGRSDPVTPPTLAVSALGAAAAAADSTWAIEFLLGRGSQVAGREVHFDFSQMAMRSHRLPVNPDCKLDHRVFTLTPIGRPVEEVSVANTFTIAEAAIGPDVTLQLNRRRLVTELRCPACDEARFPCRVLEAMTQEEARCRQGHPMEPLAFGLRDRLGRHDLAAQMGRTWAELGLPSEDVLTALRGDTEINLLFAPSRAPSAIEPVRREESLR